MTSMRTLRINEFRKPLVMESVAIPEIGPDDALVRVTASGICRTDWHLWNGDWTWAGVKLPLPTTLGHEIGGVIERVGDNVKHTAGTSVTVPFNFACGHCPYCHSRRQNLCDTASWPFMLEGSGGWAQYVRVPNAQLNCVALPEGVTELDAAALGCRYMTAYRAVRTQAAIRGGETVTIVGAGGVGQAAIEIAIALGARVIAVDKRDDRLAGAKKLGATEVVNSTGLTPEQVGAKVRAITGGRGTEVSVDAVGLADSTLAAMESLQRGGRMSTVGLTSQEDKGLMTMPIDKFVFNEWTMTGSLGNPHSDYPGLLRMIQDGLLHPSQHVSREVALEDVQSVLDKMPTFDNNGFVVITKFH